MEIWKALAHLYPTAQPLLDYEIREGGTGAFIAVWDLPGQPPTPAQLVAASAAYDAAAATKAQGEQQLRQQVLALAQSAVGSSVGALTAAQVRALLVVLLRKQGALTAAGVVRPLGEWA